LIFMLASLCWTAFAVLLSMNRFAMKHRLGDRRHDRDALRDMLFE
jgi:hypothetical protein